MFCEWNSKNDISRYLFLHLELQTTDSFIDEADTHYK